MFGLGSFMSLFGGESPKGGPGGPFWAPAHDWYGHDQIKSDLINIPDRGPNELDQYGRETPEMRRRYLDIARTEAVIRSALLIKCAEVAARPVSVMPDDEKDPRSKQIAEFVGWTVRKCPGGGSAGILMKIYRPALVMGWSLSEPRFGAVGAPDNRLRSPKYKGLWGLTRFASKDTTHLRLEMDPYRNVTGVTNYVRGIEAYSRERVVLYSHLSLFDNPFGESDLRAAYRTVGMIDDAYRLWYFALQTLGEPYFVGKTAAQNRTLLEGALRNMKSGRFVVLTNPQDEVQLLNLAAATGFDAFERKVRILREEAFMAINGTYQPFMQSNAGKGETRGNTETSKDAGSDPLLELAQRAMESVLNDDLIPMIVRPNFGDEVACPTAHLGGHDWQETKTLMEVAKAKKELGGSVGKRWLAETSQVPDAEDPADELQPPQPAPGPGQPGMPGAGGTHSRSGLEGAPVPAGRLPGAVGSSPTPTALPPHPPEPGPKTFAAEPAPVSAADVLAEVDDILAGFARPFPRAPASPGRGPTGVR